MVHGEGRVEDVILAKQSHREQGVDSEHEAGVLEDGGLWEAGGARGVDVHQGVVIVTRLLGGGGG